MFIKKRSLYIVFFLSLCFLNIFYSNLARAEHGLIDTMKASNIYPTPEETKRAKYLAAMRTCGGFKRAHLLSTKKAVALTFDDGPSIYTNEILEILRANNINGTFFFLGQNIKDYQHLVKKAYLYGNIIANHTYSHPYLTKLSGKKIEAELTKTNELVYELTGVYPALFRPPYGCCSNKSREIVKNLGFNTIMWSSSTEDYLNKITPIKIAYDIINLVYPGAIICLHDGGGNRKKTVKALKIIILALKMEGYEFLTVPELLKIPAYLDPPLEEDTEDTSQYDINKQSLHRLRRQEK